MSCKDTTKDGSPAVHDSGGFQKRDGGRKDTETLISRLVDRCLRPVFKKGWANETQVLAWVYSFDGVHGTEPLAITAASAALAISGEQTLTCFDLAARWEELTIP